MPLGNKNNKVLSIVSSLGVMWLLLAIVNSAKNHEYANIVESLSNTSQLGQCSIKTDVERDWQFGWTPSSMTVFVEKKEQKVSTVTSRFVSLPDRVQLSPRYTRYHFQWSARESGNLRVSYMNVEILDSVDGTQNVKKLTLGACSNYPESLYNYTNLVTEDCLEKVEVIECF
ncbi:MAG: hypothetical protein OQK51_19580 [Kangiellaceae bacterium]|nr:hypothetical protein [Kangiellaceae bacterium]